MSTQESLTKTIIKRTYRVPRSAEHAAAYQTMPNAALSRQLDVALISVGFKASAELLEYVSKFHPVEVQETSNNIIEAVTELVGDHVKHNVYFKNFPENVPATIEFWAELIQKTYGDGVTPHFINLLDLDDYGVYQHTYEEMVKAHGAFRPNAGGKLTTLHLGNTLQEETHALYLQLAESKVPANGDDLELLKRLTELHLGDPQPETIPVRENKAVINSIRIANGKEILVDTVTDVLRLAVYLSDGDVTLVKPSKFRKFNSTERKGIMMGLEVLIADNNSKLGDVFKYREQLKQLQRYLHISKYESLKYAQLVFEVAREGKNLSFEAKVERAFEQRDLDAVLGLLQNAPGKFVRSFNRILMTAKIVQVSKVVKTLEEVAPKVSTPVLISLRQYLGNRTETKTNRIFINKKGTGKVVEDKQSLLIEQIVRPIVDKIDTELTSRIPEATYVFDTNIKNVALPLSNKHTAEGFNVLPRGSKDVIETEILRLFMYWKQKDYTTDYDLSAILLDEGMNVVGQVSYTNLKELGIVHSGDITEAQKGASEFIDIPVDKLPKNVKYIVPQVNKYHGEDFDQVEESFFGYMNRTEAEKGKPFEARTVQTKAELRGKNKVALPLVFIVNDGTVTVKWVNAFIQGMGWGNATENNKLTTKALVQSIIETDYLPVGYVMDLIQAKDNADVMWVNELDITRLESDGPIYFIGREALEGIPENVKTITLQNLTDLLF